MTERVAPLSSQGAAGTVRHGRTEGRRRLDSPAAAPELDGWVESGQAVLPAPIISLSAEWQVPKTPREHTATSEFALFPGLQQAENVVSILQPCVSWNYYFSRNIWVIQSDIFTEDLFDPMFSGDIHQPYEGDDIVGIMNGAACDSSGSCATWTIETLDKTTGEASKLTTNPPLHQIFDWAFGVALEAYSITNCDQLPQTSVKYVNIRLEDSHHDVDAYPLQIAHMLKQNNPNCNFAGITKPGSVELSWSTVNLPPPSSGFCIFGVCRREAGHGDEGGRDLLHAKAWLVSQTPDRVAARINPSGVSAAVAGLIALRCGRSRSPG